MKSIYETFEDEEHERLKAAKGELSWHDFIMQLASDGAENNESKSNGEVSRELRPAVPFDE